MLTRPKVMADTLRATNDYGQRVLPLDELYITVNNIADVENVKRIEDSIKSKGMDNPIVVLRTTMAEWDRMHTLSPELLPPPEGVKPHTPAYLIMCGNNRAEIAKKLCYSKIDALVFNNKEEVSFWCKKFRKEWKEQSLK